MNDETIPKPRPLPTPTSAPYWDALARDEVMLQRCMKCHEWVHYPRRRCPSCLSTEMAWERVSGEGTIFTFSVARQPTAVMFGDEVPQIIAVVELREGVHITSTIVGCAPEDVAIGAEVVPVFDHGTDGSTLLRYRLR